MNESSAAASSSTDVVIIGAGPIGLFAVFQCGMLGFKCHVVDVLSVAGGQCAALYPEKPIFDIPAHPNIESIEMVDQLLAQAAPFHPHYHLGHPVLRLEPIDPTNEANPGWRVGLDGGGEITAKAVIIAAGNGAIGPVRLPLDGAENFEGESLFYVVRRKSDLAGKRVVIAGGGDSAVDWALALDGVAEHISVVHRRNKFRAAPESVRQMHGALGYGHPVSAKITARHRRPIGICDRIDTGWRRKRPAHRCVVGIFWIGEQSGAHRGMGFRFGSQPHRGATRILRHQFTRGFCRGRYRQLPRKAEANSDRVF